MTLGALPLTNPASIQLKSSSDCSAEAIGPLCRALLGEAASGQWALVGGPTQFIPTWGLESLSPWTSDEFFQCFTAVFTQKNMWSYASFLQTKQYPAKCSCWHQHPAYKHSLKNDSTEKPAVPASCVTGTQQPNQHPGSTTVFISLKQTWSWKSSVTARILLKSS